MVKRSISWRSELFCLARYGSSGVVNTVVGLTVIFSMMAADFSPMLSNAGGYFVGFILSFVISKKMVFRSNCPLLPEGMKYLAAFLLSFAFNLGVLDWTISIGVDILICQLIAAIAYTSMMYSLTRFLVFNH